MLCLLINHPSDSTESSAVLSLPVVVVVNTPQFNHIVVFPLVVLKFIIPLAVAWVSLLPLIIVHYYVSLSLLLFFLYRIF